MPSMKPLSLVVTEKTDLRAETEHFDHAQVHVHADTHQGYHISTLLLHKCALKISLKMQLLLSRQAFGNMSKGP